MNKKEYNAYHKIYQRKYRKTHKETKRIRPKRRKLKTGVCEFCGNPTNRTIKCLDCFYIEKKLTPADKKFIKDFLKIESTKVKTKFIRSNHLTGEPFIVRSIEASAIDFIFNVEYSLRNDQLLKKISLNLTLENAAKRVDVARKLVKRINPKAYIGNSEKISNKSFICRCQFHPCKITRQAFNSSICWVTTEFTNSSF